MSEATQQLLSTVLALPRQDREYFCKQLADSLDFDDQEDDPEFIAMLDRRIEEMRTDPSKRLPAREALARLREKYK